MTGQHYLEADTGPTVSSKNCVTSFRGQRLKNAPAPDEDYFTLGLVSSLMALELVTFVEQRFGIAVEVEALGLDNFRTMSRTAEFIRGKRSVVP